MRLSKEQLVTTPTTLNYLSESAYDYTKWNLGKGLIYNNGATAVDKYISPSFQAIRPMEESTAFAALYSFAYNLSSTTAYVFGVENSTGATATRRVHLWEINRKTDARTWKGFITLTLATATAHTCRDFKIDVKNETTGTVSVSGTAVTGTSTLFATNKVAVGARIGFGSTNPASITTWYRISTRTSDTALVLASSAPTYSAGTAYVIQEFRPVYLATNATTTNGGIHYAKGVSIEDFTPAGTTIALATTADDAKAVYWLKDAATQTNIVAAGMACDFAGATATTLDTHVIDLVSAGNYKFYKYNLRAPLTVASGNSVSAWVLTTGNNTFTGTGSQNANLCIATASHGTGSGVKSLYFVSTTRWMRAPVTNITSGSTTVIADTIIEVPPGGTSTFAVTGALSTVEYLSAYDRFIVGSTHASGAFSYVTRFVSSGTEFDKMFGRNFFYTEQSAKDNRHPTIFSNQATVCAYHDAGENRVFITKAGTAITTNHIYVVDFGGDNDYADSNQGYLISPQITTSNALKYYIVFANHVNTIGSGELAKPTDGFRLYARTANITTDATTGWTLLGETNDLSGFAGASSIQFKIVFKTISESLLPARILGVNVEYEDDNTDSHYALATEKCSTASKIFAWYFATAFGSTVPTMRVNLYDTDTGGLLLTDTTTASAFGTFEKSTDGTTWGAYNTTDRANATTYVRYTPSSLADNIKVDPRFVQA